MATVKLYAGSDTMIVHHLRGLLESEGISATVLGETLGFARGDLPMTVETMPAIWIDEQDVQRAMPIVREFMAKGRDLDDDADADEPTSPPWQCPGCGKRIEPQFSACWHCGAERPATPPPLPPRS